MSSAKESSEKNIIKQFSIRNKITIGISTILLLTFFSLSYITIKSAQEGVNESFKNEAIAIVSNINSFIGTKEKIDKGHQEIETVFYELINKNQDIAIDALILFAIFSD